MSDGTIGVFDSGVGGLSIVRRLLAALPEEPLHYVADSVHCPYGSRGAEEIVALSVGISRYLVESGAKAIVVACNTASAAALATLRATFPGTPFVGMVPAVKPAAGMSRSGIIGVLATPGTFDGRLYREVVEQHAAGARVLASACAGLVGRIEAGDLDGPETVGLLRRAVAPLLEAGADTLVLGCTHYPFVIPALQRLLPEGVQVIEPSEAIARQTARVLRERGLVRGGTAPPAHVFATTGAPAAFGSALRRLLGLEAEPVGLEWSGGRLGRRGG